MCNRCESIKREWEHIIIKLSFDSYLRKYAYFWHCATVSVLGCKYSYTNKCKQVFECNKNFVLLANVASSIKWRQFTFLYCILQKLHFEVAVLLTIIDLVKSWTVFITMIIFGRQSTPYIQRQPTLTEFNSEWILVL